MQSPVKSSRIKINGVDIFLEIYSKSVAFIISERLYLHILCVYYVYVYLATKSHPTLCSSTDCSSPGFSVHGISQQEYWTGLPFPSPGDLPNSGVEPASPALAGGFFTTDLPGKF